ncbi:Uncharacterized protein involved in response to NO [Nitrosomonas nitrosa]|uniref:Uncharacterized protein involved in response to NO n=1 Tax=Nitrosomonas nitrosa TaxID=52442 RepID=A0A1I4R9T2_9PROT|nr:NnrS family protein [Nitrosomonas nitrosa]SFM49021.1 Uncharacterized protein involved in response to NO [Nitrosomonas nitrosa]
MHYQRSLIHCVQGIASEGGRRSVIRLKRALEWLPGKTKTYAHQWFFMAACIYAILMVPLAMLARHGYGPAVLAAPTVHAFEMLFGFVLALITGYLLGPMPKNQLLLFLLLWLLARVLGVIAIADWLALISNAVFVALLAWHLLPRLWVAKKWRNRTLVPLLGLICSLTVVIALIGQFDDYRLQRTLLGESVQLFALLMLFMGGRMLAPAVAGEFYRQGMELEARVQPQIEAGLIVTLTAAFLLASVPTLSGVMLIIGGLLAAIRLIRWQLWHCLARPDLICLGVGYGWLALGLLSLGWVKLTGSDHLGTAVHVITVGALGTLAANVMVRVTLLQVKQYPSRIPQIVIMTGIMAIAAIARISADLSLYREMFLAIAAVAWSMSFLLCLYVIFDCQTRVLSRKSL